MATHSSILAWKIPWREEPGSLQFIVLQRVRPTEHARTDTHKIDLLKQYSVSFTAVLLPGKSHGQRSLVGCSPWGAKGRTRLSDFTFTFTSIHWKRKWQPIPVFLPGESQGRGSLVGCRLWGRTESDTTEAT